MRGEDFTGFLLSICSTIVSFYVLQFAPYTPLPAASIATANELLHIHHCTSVYAPLCVSSCTPWYRKASESHACPVSWFCAPGNLFFLHTLRIAPITIILKTAPVWVVHRHLVHTDLLWPRSHGYKGLVYLEMEAYWLHSCGRALTCKISRLDER